MNTSATPALQALDIDMFIDPNFGRMTAYRRALKVFMKSCMHFRQYRPYVYRELFQEYSNKIAELYEVSAHIDQMPRQEFQQMLQQIVNTINNERIRIRFAGLRYIGDFVNSAKLSVNFGTISGNTLEWEVEFEPHLTETLAIGVGVLMTAKQFYYLVRTKKNIEISYEDIYWGDSRQDFEVFRLPYREIHPEGYEQWIQFGRDIEILVSIRFEALEENPNPQEVQAFHLNSLYLMLVHRLDEYRVQANSAAHMHRPLNDKPLTFLKPRVKYFAKKDLWETQPNPNSNSVKYIDMQIGFENEEIIVGEFCICNEFCNLNAFFHYNPIYRFLLVHHNRLYIKNRTNMANIYMLVLCVHLADQPPHLVSQTPLIGLLISADVQRALNWGHILMNRRFRNRFNALPDIMEMIGLTYNLLRYDIPLADISIENDRIPFCDQTLDNMSHYNKALFNLHSIIGDIPTFVDIANRKMWTKEFESFGRNNLFIYIIWSYDETQNAPNPGTDYLFSEDFEYSTQITKSKKEQEVIDSLKSILMARDEPNGNPFNVRLECQPFTYSVIKVWEYITKYEPQLSVVYEVRAIKDIMDFCKDLDNGFKQTILTPNHTQYRVDCPNFPQPLDGVRDQMFVFYKLKVYFYAYSVQKYFIESTINYTEKVHWTPHQAFVDFKHIWDNEWIEKIFETQYPNEEIRLFSSDIDILPDRFERFYVGFWGRPPYETQRPVQAMPQIMTQVLYKYVDLLYWQQNNGDNRLKFRAILEEYYRYLNRVATESRAVYDNHIIGCYPTLKSLYGTDDHYIEVIDNLIYWLVKATGFMLLRQTMFFLFYIRRREVFRLVNDSKMFVLSKPGFVPLIRSKREIFRILDVLKAHYIVFDDIFNRIARTISQIKSMAKHLYKNFYNKLAHNWMYEIYDMYTYNHQYSETTMKFHLINGLSFVAAFIDDFRRPSHKVRRYMRRLRETNLTANTTQIAFNQTWDQCMQWLRDLAQIRLATPFVSPIYVQYLAQELAQFAPLQPSRLQLFAAADQL